MAKVYMNKILAGMLMENSDSSFTFRYDDEYFSNPCYSSISLTLPKTQQEYHSKIFFPFFYNMLSEGANKRIHGKKNKSMKQGLDIKNCPGTLTAGYNTYCPTALRRMFDNRKVSHLLDFSNEESHRDFIFENAGRISISGVQEKLSAIVEKGKICLALEGVQNHYIIKPAPDDKRLNHRYTYEERLQRLRRC
jgi:HipA-like protein